MPRRRRSAAERAKHAEAQRVHRERSARGDKVVPIVLRDADVETMVLAGLLPRELEDDRRAIGEALMQYFTLVRNDAPRDRSRRGESISVMVDGESDDWSEA